jgi:hypothetical protein
MKGSIAERVADHVAEMPERTFVATRDIDGPRTAVESAFSRIAAVGEVARIRKGLYWKGAQTPLGITPPRVEEVGVELGGPGSGPAGVAAAAWLGLTTQVPSTYVVAVPTRTPTPWRRIRFTQRPVERLLRDLTPTEVAVIEVLRAGASVLEGGWDRFTEAVIEQAAQGRVRLDVLDAEIADEPHRAARARWAAVRAELPELRPVA